jgi:muramoyltetrapeptide carboxypeptidase
VEESLHDIDRLFYMLRLQGDLERVTGIILGEFFAVRYDLQYDSVEEMLSKHIQDSKIPVCCGFPAGSNSCIPLIMGAPVELDVTPDNSTLTFQMSGEQHYYWIDKSEKQLLK